MLITGSTVEDDADARDLRIARLDCAHHDAFPFDGLEVVDEHGEPQTHLGAHRQHFCGSDEDAITRDVERVLAEELRDVGELVARVLEVADASGERREAYDRASALTWLERLATPLLVVHGMADDNVLFTNSTKLFKTAKMKVNRSSTNGTATR